METTTTKTENKMVEKFKELKAKHPDAVILFRCGDFYESRFDDAKKLSEVLGLTLTRQAKTEMDLAGFPYHALDTYLPKLIMAGIRVAICDDISDSDKLMTFPIAEDAEAEEIKTQEPQQEEEDPKHYPTVYTPENGKWLCEPKNGTTFELEEMQEIVGGYIEVIRLNDGRVIIVDSQGKALNKAVNIPATNILRRDHFTTDYIVGTAIVCDADMVE